MKIFHPDHSHSSQSAYQKRLIVWLCVSSFCVFFPLLLSAGIAPSQNTSEALPNTSLKKEKTLSFDFYNVPVEEAIRAISLQQDINISIDPDIKGNVSAHISNLPIGDGLNCLLHNLNATFKKDGNMYTIVKKKAVQKDFHIEIKNGFMDLYAKEIPLKKILQSISQKIEMNLTFDPNIHGAVSANFKHIDSLKGLKILLATNNYKLQKKNSIYIIKRRSSQYQLYVNYKDNKLSIQSTNTYLKDIFQEISSQTGLSIVCTTVVAGKATAVIQNEDVETALKLLLIGTPFQCKKYNNVYVIGDGNNLKKPCQFFTKSVLYRLKHLRAEEVVKKIPPSIPKENIKFFEEHNSISLSGSDELIQTAVDFLKAIDKPIAQIKVDVLIVEYDRSANKKRGLKMAELTSSFPSSMTQTSFNLGKDSETIRLTYDIAKGLTKGFFMHLSNLIDHNKAKVTANPSICTLNGKEASIDVVTEDRFREHVYNSETKKVDPYGSSQTIESGVKLKIKPWITGDKEINLSIEPEVSNATGTFSADSLPQTTKRKAKTILKIKDGHTLIIGGLLQSHSEISQQEIPLLRKIPIIKHLFSHQIKNEKRTELVFYITPTISTGISHTPIKEGPLFFNSKNMLHKENSSPVLSEQKSSPIPAKDSFSESLSDSRKKNPLFLNKASQYVDIDSMGQFRREGSWNPPPQLRKREQHLGFEESDFTQNLPMPKHSEWDREVDKIIAQDDSL